MEWTKIYQYLQNILVHSVVYSVPNGFSLIVNIKANECLKQKMIKPANTVCH